MHMSAAGSAGGHHKLPEKGASTAARLPQQLRLETVYLHRQYFPSLCHRVCNVKEPAWLSNASWRNHDGGQRFGMLHIQALTWTNNKAYAHVPWVD